MLGYDDVTVDGPALAGPHVTVPVDLDEAVEADPDAAEH
ncbi:MAG: hypothetical protein JWP90_1517, partial [Mycetocola sp.]|nr:hypothetical protein [Mycetocola sp.]